MSKKKKLTWTSGDVLGRKKKKYTFSKADYIADNIVPLLVEHEINPIQIDINKAIDVMLYFFPFENLVLDANQGIRLKGWDDNAELLIIELIKTGVTVDTINLIGKLNKTINDNRFFKGDN